MLLEVANFPSPRCFAHEKVYFWMLLWNFSPQEGRKIVRVPAGLILLVYDVRYPLSTMFETPCLHTSLLYLIHTTSLLCLITLVYYFWYFRFKMFDNAVFSVWYTMYAMFDRSGLLCLIPLVYYVWYPWSTVFDTPALLYLILQVCYVWYRWSTMFDTSGLLYLILRVYYI